jgi:hypothetical protein
MTRKTNGCISPIIMMMLKMQPKTRRRKFPKTSNVYCADAGNNISFGQSNKKQGNDEQ